MLAVAVPLPSVPFTACAVIVSTWFVLTALTSVGGLISIHASTHFFNASSHGFAAAAVHSAVFTPVSVARAIDCPSTGIVEAACTLDVPATADVIVTWQEAVAAPPT